jgi:hypothetical protein
MAERGAGPGVLAPFLADTAFVTGACQGAPPAEANYQINDLLRLLHGFIKNQELRTDPVRCRDTIQLLVQGWPPIPLQELQATQAYPQEMPHTTNTSIRWGSGSNGSCGPGTGSSTTF